MIEKIRKKKRVIITVTAVLVALSVLFAVLYHNYTKEICVIEPLEHMEQREGVSVDNILVEIKYSVITNGEDVENYLYVFKNGDVYSGYNIDYRYVQDNSNQEQWERERYFNRMDDRYWDYLYEQHYWGRLSPRDLNGIISELAQVEIPPYHEPIDARPEPQIGIQKGMQTGTQTGIQTGIQISTQIVMQMESQTERTNDQEIEDFYGGHSYRGRMEYEGTEDLWWISRGSAEKVTAYRTDEHSHNAINIIKSTWAYEQWTNQIFGEGWEERIDLKDELEGDSF